MINCLNDHRQSSELFIIVFALFVLHVYIICSLLLGVGRWKWGTRKKFFRFPQKHESINLPANSAANTQLLIELLDSMDAADSIATTSYLRGHTGFRSFRKLVADCLWDRRIASVLWADAPAEVILLSPPEMSTEKHCRLAREQLKKMLNVGALTLEGFQPPVRPAEPTGASTSPSTAKRAKTVVVEETVSHVVSC